MSSKLAGPELEREILHRLAEWEHAGFISAEQLERIVDAERGHEAARPPTAPSTAPHIGRPGGPSVVEALAYVGAALVIAACGVLLGRLWTDMAVGVRAGLLGALALGGIAAGMLLRVGGDAASRRLRAVAWTGAVLATAGTAGELAAAGDLAGRDVVLVAAATAALLAIVLWSRSGAALLHVATFAALTVTVGSAAAHFTPLHDQAAPLGIWLFAAGWWLLSRLWDAVPRMPGELLACGTAIIAAQVTGQVAWGVVLALATAAAVIALAVLGGNLPLLVVGAYGVLTAVPAAMDRLVPGSVGVAVGLLVAGLVLIGSAVLIVRKRQRARTGSPPAG